MMMSPCRVRAWTATLLPEVAGSSGAGTELRTAPRSLLASTSAAVPGDVADRDLTGRDVRLQCIDAVQVDLARCQVQLARAERAVRVHAGVRQVCGHAGACGQVDRDGDRALVVARDGRLDRQLTGGEVDLRLVGHLHIRPACLVDGFDQHHGVGPVAGVDPYPGTGDFHGGGDGPWRGECRHETSPLSRT
jgi:hypothetical protein